MQKYYNKIYNYIKDNNHPIYEKDQKDFDLNYQKQLLFNKLQNENINDDNLDKVFEKLFLFKNRFDKSEKLDSFKNTTSDNTEQFQYGGILNEINAGGTHQQNIYGGVPMGSSQSQTNKVEEGETIVKLKDKDYVFSNRILLDDKITLGNKRSNIFDYGGPIDQPKKLNLNKPFNKNQYSTTIEKDNTNIQPKFTKPEIKEKQIISKTKNDNVLKLSNDLGISKEDAKIITQIQEDQLSNPQILKEYVPQSTGSKLWENLTNPLTNLGYAVRGEDRPDYMSKRDRNPLDYAVDVLNPFSWADYGYKSMSDYGDALGKVYEGDYKGAGQSATSGTFNLLGAIPAYGSVDDLSKIGKAVQEIPKNNPKVYMKNPFAEKFIDKNASYRIAGEDSYLDFLESGVLRSGKGVPGEITFGDGIPRQILRTTPFPSFQKGYADLQYLNETMKNYVYKTKVPTFKRGDINPITGNPIKSKHYAHRPIDMITGKVITELPAKDVTVFGTKPHWLFGYPKIKK